AVGGAAVVVRPRWGRTAARLALRAGCGRAAGRARLGASTTTAGSDDPDADGVAVWAWPSAGTANVTANPPTAASHPRAAMPRSCITRSPLADEADEQDQLRQVLQRSHSRSFART
ncbi:MAG: hypothetical protein QM576_13360, partial [Rhodopseudomonas sp.]|uniref:hypothetical protein n=1 Tax=Rhodopseudomonas sp. TaxID=1078 RepID=UPI0039E40E03